MSLWRQLSGWTALLCLGLMAAGDARCFAADTPPPPAAAPAVDVPGPVPEFFDFVDGEDLDIEVVAVAAVAPAAAAPAPAKPATHPVSILGAIVNAFGGDRDTAVDAQEAANKQRQAIEEQNRRNLEAQFRPQFEQLLYGELAFLRRACKPDAKVFLEVAKAAKADLRVPLREYVSAVYMPQFGGVRSGRADDPRAAVEKLLTPLAEAKLGQEKARLYRQECDKRTEAHKHAVVLNLVAVLDERLVLTAPQRAKLVESLSSKYDNSWEQYCQMFVSNNNQNLPPIPDPSIVPLLDEKQKSVWQQTSKLNQQVYYGVAINRGNQFGEAAEIQEIAHMVEEVKDAP